ncbi:MAG: GDSL-type esterase/lipase family protein [Candidatus Binatia bacterium]
MRNLKHRFLRAVLTAVAIGGIALVLGEAVLQIASLFAHDRARDTRPSAPHRIIALGDSHTFGAGVPSEDAYPAQLQVFLDEKEAGAYSVINLGVPGMNTSQVLHRLPVYVGLYHPETVLIWCGINNAWNVTEASESSGWAFLDGVASRSRLYRLLRVWIHDRQLERTVAHDGKMGRLDLTADVPIAVGPNVQTSFEREGRIETIVPETREFALDSTMRSRAIRDYAAMADYARAAGLSLVFVTYPIELGVFKVANEAMRTVAANTGATLVNSSASLARVPKDRQMFIWAAHPTGPIYREIARDVAALIESRAATR